MNNEEMRRELKCLEQRAEDVLKELENFCDKYETYFHIQTKRMYEAGMSIDYCAAGYALPTDLWLSSSC